MQDKNLNGHSDFDNTQEEFVDISSESAGFIKPDYNDDEKSEDDKTDINQISSNLETDKYISDKPTKEIEFVQDVKSIENSSESSEENSKQKKRYSTSEKKNFFVKHKLLFIITSAAVVVIAAVGVVLWQLASNGIIPNPFEETVGPIVNEEGEFTFLSGVQISGIDISGKTYDEAKKLLEDNKSKFADDFTMTVEANEKSYEFASKDFTYTYNIEEILNQAKKYCEDAHKGEIDVTQPTTDDQGHYSDMYTVTATVVEDSIEAVSNKIAEDTDVEVKNARVSKFTPFAENKFEYEDGSVGYKTNKEDLVAAIKAFINAKQKTGVISAKIDVVEPKITKEMVKKNIVPLSYFTTTSVNTENATLNMGTALSACNGSIIEPGETWSFNECTGDSNLESNGYLPAGVISDGSMTQGIGGGLCQASSTIYNAAVFANMEIVERHNHFWASVYVPAGLDATIDYPGLDLKLKNITDYQMFMECTINGRELSCTIYGYQDPSYDDIVTYSENYDIVSGESYDTTSYRVLYKNGNEVSREELPSSHYSLTEGHYVQYSDEGTHRKRPEGAANVTSNSSEDDSSDKPKQDTADNSGDNDSQSEVSNNNNNNAGENSTVTDSSPSSNTATGSDNGNNSSSSNTTDSQTPPVEQSKPETLHATEGNSNDENANE